MLLFFIASEILSGNGPELPMQVVHPYTTKLKPNLSKWTFKPAFSKQSVTTWDPGARDVLTQGFVDKPFSIAFLARSPAPIKTLGLDVFVQDVIAAITISPSFIS